MPSSLRSLDAHLQVASTPWSVRILGALAGTQLPLQILLVSLALATLERGALLAPIEISQFLTLPNAWSELSSLRVVTILLGIAFALSLLQSIMLWGLYCLASTHAIEKVSLLFREIFRKSGQLALSRSISGQQASLREAIDQSTPKVTAAWEVNLRTSPRYYVQAILGSLLALLIHPIITILAAVGIALLAQLYRTLDQRTRTHLPVLRERSAGINRRIRELCESGPLLDFVHAGEAAAASLEHQLRALKENEGKQILTRSWKTPMMAIAITLVGCLIGFVLAIRIVANDSHLHISGAIALVGSLVATAFAIQRIEQAWTIQREGQEAAQSLLHMFAQPELERQENWITPSRPIQKGMLLEYVTLKDSEGRKLLEDVSVDMQPGKLIAIVSNQRLHAKALAELILGFGKPHSGRMLLDGTNTIDLDPDALRANSAWISQDGPLVAGTIEDNLHSHGRPASMSDLMEALRLAFVYDAVQNLSDGISTFVSTNDDRLSPDQLFRLGIARTLVHNPMLVVAEEPGPNVASTLEAETLQALRQLTQRRMLVVVLPERLATLRDADSIVVLRDHRLEAIGTHTELLQSNEFYRHLNYLRFSDLKHIALQ